VALPNVAGGDEGEGLGANVQTGDGQVDGYPDAVLGGAQEIAFLRMKNAGLVGGPAQTLLAALAAELEEIGGREAEQLSAGEARKLFGQGIDVLEHLGVRIEEEQGIARFLEQRLGQVLGIASVHNVSKARESLQGSAYPSWRATCNGKGPAWRKSDDFRYVRVAEVVRLRGA
jgi:hypothetical protein